MSFDCNQSTARIGQRALFRTQRFEEKIIILPENEICVSLEVPKDDPLFSDSCNAGFLRYDDSSLGLSDCGTNCGIETSLRN